MNIEKENEVLRAIHGVHVLFELQKIYMKKGYTQVVIQTYLDRGGDLILNFEALDRRKKLSTITEHARSYEELESKVLGNKSDDSSDLL